MLPYNVTLTKAEAARLAVVVLEVDVAGRIAARQTNAGKRVDPEVAPAADLAPEGNFAPKSMLEIYVGTFPEKMPMSFFSNDNFVEFFSRTSIYSLDLIFAP